MESEIVKILSDLSNFVKTVSPEVWKILVQQQVIEGVIGLIGAISVYCGMFVCFILIRVNPKCIAIDGDPVPAVILGVGLFIACIPLTILLFAQFIPQLLNPQYYALMSIKP